MTSRRHRRRSRHRGEVVAIEIPDLFFILETLAPGADERLVTTAVALAAVVLFAFRQCLGVGAQARVMEWMTSGAMVALVWFGIACIPGIRIERLLTDPILPGAATPTFRRPDIGLAVRGNRRSL